MNRLGAIVAALDGAGLLVQAPLERAWPVISGVTADSRQVERDMLFCAIRGTAQDGHRFDAGGSPCRDLSGQQSHSAKKGYRRRENQRVGRLGPEK